MINTRPFTFVEGNRNNKIRGRCWWPRRQTFQWRRVGWNWL